MVLVSIGPVPYKALLLPFTEPIPLQQADSRYCLYTMAVVIYHQVMSWLSVKLVMHFGFPFQERYWTLFGLPWWLWLKLGSKNPALWIHMNACFWVNIGFGIYWPCSLQNLTIPIYKADAYVKSWLRVFSLYKMMTVIYDKVWALGLPFWERFCFRFGTTTFLGDLPWIYLNLFS